MLQTSMVNVQIGVREEEYRGYISKVRLFNKLAASSIVRANSFVRIRHGYENNENKQKCLLAPAAVARTAVLRKPLSPAPG